MTSLTYASICSGGELAGVGARLAGLEDVWGVEIERRIADIAMLNGFAVLNTNVLNVDPSVLESPFLLHASLPCPNFSPAKNAGAVESSVDMLLARKCAEFLRVMRPPAFALENVCQYVNSQSFKIVTDALTELGYGWCHDCLDAADFGVPQSRKRLIMRALRDGDPPELKSTLPRRGWFEAIEDLFHTMPEDTIPPYQFMRLPLELQAQLLAKNVTTPVLLWGWRGGSANAEVRWPHQPSKTVTAKTQVMSAARVCMGDRVMQLTPRALARLQSVPDSYQLSGVAIWDVAVVGNGCPSLLMKQVYETLIHGT